MAELPKRYDPKAVEPKWYQRWLENRDFVANPESSKPPFSIVMPPPNITGMLTLGHVLNDTIQDILARRARMQGFEVLWLPGMDHAGIGTQTAVEKYLRKTENKTRHDLGREEFLRRVLEWQDKHGGIIIEQLKRLGCSCDWSRQRYTLDDAYAAAVQKVFVDLYDKGLIYRGRRMINWDPAAQTAVSDEEVINKPQKGHLYFVRYEIVEERRPLSRSRNAPGRKRSWPIRLWRFIRATNDTVDLLGKHAWRPLAREKIPIIADEAIDPEFGTGVLKVTPAHDTLDFEIGQRHDLPIIDVLTPAGRVNCPAVPELHGLERFEARKKAAELLEARGLLAKRKPMRTILDSAIAATCQSSRDSVSNGFCATRKQKKRSRSSVIISSVSFQRTGKKFTRNGWRTFATGASAVRCGGDTGYRRGTGNPKSQIPNPKATRKFTSASSRRLIPRTGSRMKTRSTPGFHRGCGLTRRWIRRRGRSFIRRAFS